MPLTMARPGERMTLVALRGGQRMRKRLADLGLTASTSLHIVQGSGHGPLIVAVRGTRLAIGRGMAHHILVKPAR